MTSSERSFIQRHRFLVLGLVWTPILFLIWVGVLWANRTLAAAALFPLATVVTNYVPALSPPTLLAVAIQWPLYGALADRFKIAMWILAVHAAAVAIAAFIVR